MLADRVAVHTAGIGEPDLSSLQIVKWELIVASADGLDETQFRRQIQEMVAPKTGDHKHLGLPDTSVPLLRRPGLEEFNARVPLPEGRAHLVGDVGKADGQGFFWWEQR